MTYASIRRTLPGAGDGFIPRPARLLPEGEHDDGGGDTANSGAADYDANASQDDSTDSPDTGDDETDWKAEAEKWKTHAQKHEQAWQKRAGDLSPERLQSLRDAEGKLQKLQRESMGEQERAVANARDEARTEVLREMGGRVVDAHIEASVAAGRLTREKADAILGGLDRTRFLGDDGDVDTDRVAAFVTAIASTPPVNDNPPFPDLGQGRRTTSKTSTADQFADSVASFLK